jgi:hypothetical protein
VERSGEGFAPGLGRGAPVGSGEARQGVETRQPSTQRIAAGRRRMAGD